MIQAEIDAVAELTDFFRFNAKFALELEGEQPISLPPSTNSVIYRGMEVPWDALRGSWGLADPESQTSLLLPYPGLCGSHLTLQLHCDRR